ncbi:MAG: high-potential iron-sulfur protein, partial [Burkholderiales bacterium]
TMSANRRFFMKTIAILPAAVVSGMAVAQNAAMKKNLQYQDTPKSGQRCDQCLHYVADPKKAGEGICKVIPNDTVKAAGWCTAWVKKA